MKILIIENADGRAEAFSEILKKLGKECEVWNPYNQPMKKVNLRLIDRVIITGGPGHAADYLKSKYYQPAKKLIENIIALNKPALGICLGHQILALMLGGEVKQTTQRYGWVKVDFEKRSALLFHYHHDEVKKLPENGVLLASSDSCKIEAFSVLGKKILGLQGHIEISPEMGQKILSGIPKKLWINSAPQKPDPVCVEIFERFCKL